jgi:DNA-binding CsgD family transcriptional regulator/tetratricopeptide (TPR) repeat protein
MGAALAKQIPALIKRFLKVTKPLSGVADLARVVLHLVAQLMLGIDHLADAREDVGVIHRDSLREARFVGISDHPGLMIMVRSTSRFRTWARTSFGHDGDYRGPGSRRRRILDFPSRCGGIDRVPNWVRLSSDRLVGRDEELVGAVKAIHRVAEGRPGVMIVSGPAGIGKSRFVSALAEQLRSEGMRAMVGACLDLGAGAPPYSSLIKAFRSVDPPAVQLLDALTGAVRMRRSRLFELLRSTTVGLAKRRPTVLVIEDVHWSDRITRDVLLYLVAMAREGRWALIVTFRDDEVSRRPALREFLDALSHDVLAHVTLDALSAENVATQIEGITGERASGQDADRIHRRSGGVPLLVEEVVAAETAGLIGVPDHLRDLFLARLDSLVAPAVAAVDVVAVMGERCDARLVARVLESDMDNVAAALDRAVAADILIAEGTGYRMRHELLREAIYSALPAGERRRIHRRVAESLLATRNPDVTALARHWYDADERAQAVLANLEAAALAERVHAPGEAHTYLERALEHFDALPSDRAAGVGGRAGLLARTAEEAHRSGAHKRAVMLAQQSLAHGDEPQVIARRWERYGLYCWITRDGAGARKAYETSIAVLPDDAPVRVRAQVLSGYGMYLMMANRMDDARNWSEKALQAAVDSGEGLEECRALLAWGYSRREDETGLAALWRARDLAIACDAGEELARIHSSLDQSLRWQGRTADREQVMRDGISHAAAHGLGGSFGLAMNYMLAEVFLDTGRWDEADDVLSRFGPRAVAGIHPMFTNAYRARLAAVRGDSATARECADRVEELARDLPDQPIPRTIAWCARAESCVWSGIPDEAMEYADLAIAITSDRMRRAEAVAIRARAAADVTERARRRGQPVADLVADARIWVAAERRPQLQALAATTRAEVSRHDGRRDTAPWRDAVAAWDAATGPYQAAYSRWRLGYALLGSRSGRSEAARELSAARWTADQLRARPLLESINRLAAAARIRLARSESEVDGAWTAASEFGLTNRELEVLPLLIAGRTNAEIADVLVISPRTVGIHVSRILAKLGASRRTEAAEIARRRGLVDD